MSDPTTPPPQLPHPNLATIDNARDRMSLKTMTRMALAIEHNDPKFKLGPDTPLLQSPPASGMDDDTLTYILAAQINTLDIAYHYLLNRAHAQYEDVANFRTACHTQNQCLRSLRLLAHLKAKQKAAPSSPDPSSPDLSSSTLPLPHE